ncbi:serine/threonine-protein kinase ATG1a [Oryza brachyantha]|uniref:Protein kinase domain-containing protein n=1 Tax=Oryza brachyantha TaxID=4533 RepID=J3LJE4_ORYBR|nr:serine/threonine-protein kinase ATG1a [Oryza brachyantha]
MAAAAERKEKRTVDPPRVVGEYKLLEELGVGSFAKVYLATHIRTGDVVAVKEIDPRRIDERVRGGILQEKAILSTLSHPNILRLIDTIQEENLYLILEYCNGGDLEGYRTKGGEDARLPEATARDFMRQLAEGLKILRGRSIVHRDLKPQNLLLSTNGDLITLKIGDFGFARSLVQENLAATMCGSPSYMAPEIMRCEDYDAKADLWSIGVILFQLVTGKLPFHGTNIFKLRQNIHESNGVKFPPEIKDGLHPDFIDLCSGLLRLDPKKRISFEEFFNHKFLSTAGSSLDSGGSVQRKRETSSEPHHPADVLKDTSQIISSDVVKVKSERVDSRILKAFDSWEWIEREYVLVHANSTSTEMLSSLEKSMKDGTGTKPASYDRSTVKRSWNQNRDSVSRMVAIKSNGCTPLSTSCESTTAENLLSPPYCYTRLQVLNQYIVVLTELAEEKLYKGLDLEALSVELIILAIWNEALNACSLSMDAAHDGKILTQGYVNLPPKNDNRPSRNVVQGLDFTRLVSVCSWAESGFIKACDRAEKISHKLRDNNDNTEMPDAVEIIFQTALIYGTAGAAKELLGYQNRSAALYSKAIILLTFVMQEATNLPLNPPFSLSASNQQRIHGYIANLRSHLCSAQLTGQQEKSIHN